MIKNIIFDLGEVLLNYKPKEYLDTFNFSDETKNKIFSATFGSDLWKEYDRGTFTNESLLNKFIELNPNLENELKEVFHSSWCEFLTEKQESIEFLKELKNKGYKIYALSNFNHEGFSFVENRYGFFENFDGKVISGQINLIKPDDDIYTYIINKFDLVPNETVFFDDSMNNIETAKKFGIHGIVFSDLSSSISEFNRIVSKNI